MNYFTQDNTDGSFSNGELSLMNEAVSVLLDGSTDEQDVKNACDKVNNNFVTNDENTIVSLIGLNLSYEYNEYVVGFIVTDKNTGRSANAQFSDRGNNDHALKFGCEGDETHAVFTETELEVMTDWLRAQDGVDELEMAYDAANSLPRDEYGNHPIADILAEGNGLFKIDIFELAELAE